MNEPQSSFNDVAPSGAGSLLPNGQMKKIKVLFVDDDLSILNGLKRSFHKLSGEMDCHYCTGATEALEKMRHELFDVVVSDLRMPLVDGVTFLREVRSRYPSVVRFVLSGYSERQMFFECMDVAHQCFNKPCDSDVLANTIRSAFRAFEHLQQPSIQEHLASIRSLPPTPEAYRSLSKEFRRGDPSIENIAEIVRRDPGMSSRILHLVNSAYHGFRDPISDISQATMLLGTDVIRSLVLITGILGHPLGRVCEPTQLEHWGKHSVSVAFLAQSIAKSLKWPRVRCETAFTAGLLHDIGWLLMFLCFGEYGELVEEFGLETPKLAEAEKERFGVQHAEMGAALLAIWGIPIDVILAVVFHHSPSLSGAFDPDLSLLVHLADAAASADMEALSDASIFLNSPLLERKTVDNSYTIDLVKQWLASEYINHKADDH